VTACEFTVLFGCCVWYVLLFVMFSWMVHFQERYKQYQSCIAEGDPKVVWLSGLHIPESYITALVQTTCRRRGWALDKSALFTQVRARRECQYCCGDETIDGRID
jgi:hypothetical protein